MAQMNLSTEKKIMDLWLPRGRGGKGVGWTGNLGLIDANYTFGMYKQCDPAV